MLAECIEEGRLLATLKQEETLDDFMAVRTAEIGLVKDLQAVSSPFANSKRP